jgi:ribosomal-protein-alanine N-acetyltransferase
MIKRMDMQQQSASQFPVLKTERVILRKLDVEDADELLKLRSDDGVNKYLDRPKTITHNEAIEFIDKIDDGINNNQWFYRAISLKNDSKLIGSICLWNIDRENSLAEVGY